MHVSTDRYEVSAADRLGEPLVGHAVKAVFLSEDRLTFTLDTGERVAYTVQGDCCSYSYFHDLTGVDYLLNNGPITGFDPVDLSPGDVGYHDDENCGGGYDGKSPCGEDHDCLAVYGYRLTTIHPVWGEVSTVVAFRNDSNGYYGGWMEIDKYTPDELRPDQIVVTSDIAGPLDLVRADPIVGELAPDVLPPAPAE